jgi:hypothetical protein
MTKHQADFVVKHQTARITHRSLKVWSGLLVGLAAVMLSYPTPTSAQEVPLGIQKMAAAQQAVGRGYYRLQLRSNGKYLDANKCSDQIGLNPGSSYADGACQLWKLVPAGGRYYRLQLKSNGKYLDANKCSDQIGLNPGSSYADGACQLWKLVRAGGEYYRLQLKSNGKYLDAKYCSDEIGLNPGSDYADGACQLWKFAPASVRID